MEGEQTRLFHSVKPSGIPGQGSPHPTGCCLLPDPCSQDTWITSTLRPVAGRQSHCQVHACCHLKLLMSCVRVKRGSRNNKQALDAGLRGGPLRELCEVSGGCPDSVFCTAVFPALQFFLLLRLPMQQALTVRELTPPGATHNQAVV